MPERRAIRTRPSRFTRSFAVAGLFAVAFCAGVPAVIPGAAPNGAARSLRPQNTDTPVEEIVANLAAGRVLIAVFKDAIVIGSVENRVEASTLTPPIVPMSSRRVGILLGAVDWFSPSARQVLARLGRELPHIRGRAAGFVQAPHLTEVPGTATAADIQQIGDGFYNRLDEITEQLHGHVNLTPEEPLTEVVLADYLETYGPEVWLMSYEIQQEPERGDFWQTRLRRPRYTQFWPPEKSEPRTLVEFDYPSDDKTLTIRDMLLAHDPRLERIRDSSQEMGSVAGSIVHGEINKQTSDIGIPFMRAALDAIAAGNREQLAVIHPETGFQWILAPPPEPKMPGEKEEKTEAAPSLERPAGAPTLQKPPL
ncbi:MAG: hypothetical protein WCA98_07270 [Candidatus Acidiferrales bacterium]